MKYQSYLYTAEYAHDGYNIPDFDQIEIEFTEKDIQHLQFLIRVANDTKYISSIISNIEPIVTPLLNGKAVPDNEIDCSHWSRAFYQIEVKVFRNGSVAISWYTKDTDAKSWVDSLDLN